MKHNNKIKNRLFFIGKKTYIRFTTHNDFVFPKRLHKTKQNTQEQKRKIQKGHNYRSDNFFVFAWGITLFYTEITELGFDMS